MSKIKTPVNNDASTLTPSAALQAFGAERNRGAVKVRVHDEPAFVIATYPWSETSLIAELLTEHHGRVPVVVRGAKRPYSKFRGLVNTFVPLLVNFSGAGDVKNLTEAKWLGAMTNPTPENLMSAFYVNELVLRMTVREDPAPELFKAYTEVLTVLAHQKGQAIQKALRRFEIELLDSLGWGQKAKEVQVEDFAGAWCVSSGELTCAAIDPVTSEPIKGEVPVSRACARAIIQKSITPEVSLAELRRVLRTIIGYYVGDIEFNTRKTLSRWSQI